MSSEVSLSRSLSLFLLASSLHKEGKIVAECPKLTLSQSSHLSRKRTSFQLPLSVLVKTLIGLAWVLFPYTSQSSWPGKQGAQIGQPGLCTHPWEESPWWVVLLEPHENWGRDFSGKSTEGVGKHSVRHYSATLHYVSQVRLKKTGNLS